MSALPVVLSYGLWSELWRGARPRAWDGTGHFAIAQIYARSIFPDTFGWTHHYFGGMPFPNFYPPFFYWCLALLEQTRLFSFTTAFKLVLAVPVIAIPAVLWLLARTLSDKNNLIAIAVALASLLLLVDPRFLLGFPAGLDYFSTFQIGLYTQPLGFVLMVLWYVSYVDAHRRRWRFLIASLLLALVVLTSFFNAVTAGLFIAATVIHSGLRFRGVQAEGASTRLLAQVGVPLAAAGLALFWLIPMLRGYEYLVTRPSILESGKLMTPALWGWYLLAVAGSVLWVRRPTRHMWPFLATCLSLAAIVVFATVLSPRWFPLQSARFLTTLNFLLTIPVGHALAAIFRQLAILLGETTTRHETFDFRRVRYTTGVSLILWLVLAFTAPGIGWSYAFYPAGEKEDMSGVLNFALHHQDGRYLVEVVDPGKTNISFDARAINSYLGSQGNETLSAVFHEASPNVLFMLPLINAFSDYPDSFGISSILADDLDFTQQPLSQHLEQARFLGVRYLVIRNPALKERLAAESGVGGRQDFGWWSVFELAAVPRAGASVLPYRPALVVSSFTLKGRRRNEWSYVRLAEEQFADNWFDVLLVRSPERNIERIQQLEDFGALILDTYDCDDCEAAYTRLREFSRHRTLILLAGDAGLFQRIRAARAEFPHLEIIERPQEDAGEMVDALKPSYHYNFTSIRQTWGALRRVLENNRMSVGASPPIAHEVRQNAINLNYANEAAKDRLPVMISTTYHPNWRRKDGALIYTVTPFNMLTFINQPTQLVYTRDRMDQAGLWLSALTLISLCLFTVWGFYKRAAR